MTIKFPCSSYVSIDTFRDIRGPVPPGTHFFHVQGESRRRIQAPRLDDALDRVLGRFNLAAPTGCYYSSHSCRKCATLAKACGVPLEDICYWGGWAVRSTAVHAYIDLSCRLHGDDLVIAREFFGWLRPPGA
ncbi:hypothetical protein NFJ02_43g110150 [Pycnococcus provasolii]